SSPAPSFLRCFFLKQTSQRSRAANSTVDQSDIRGSSNKARHKVLIRRELPRTEIASSGRSLIAQDDTRILLSVPPRPLTALLHSMHRARLCRLPNDVRVGVCRRCILWTLFSFRLYTNCPDEAEELAGDRAHGFARLFSGCKRMVSPIQPSLSLPCD